MAMRKPGVYVALSANYADDEAIMDAGEDAELMYIRMLAYAARTPLTEGWISDRVILSRLGIIARAAGNGAGNVAGTDAGSRAGVLCTVGLIHRDGEGYRITSWLKWNRSIEEMGREKSRDAGRKKPVTSDDDGTDAGNVAGNGAGLPAASPLSDQNTYTDQIRSVAADAETSSTDSKPKSRRKPSTSIPDGWAPSDKHAELALARGVDLVFQAEKFRNWSEAKDARYANWDAAFRNWLTNSDPGMSRPVVAQAARSPWDNKVQHIGSAA